ncbi:MAG: hypothetical protein AAF213_13190 [Pseudomonadota bacterium]
MEVQAKLLAIHKAEAALPKEAQQDLYGIRDAAKLDTALKKAGVTDTDIVAARAEVDSTKGMPRAVPMLGAVATSFRLVSHEVKNALMTAQAGQRTLLAGELMGAMQTGSTPAPAANTLPGIVMDGRNPDEPARSFIGKFKDDPVNVVGAQAAHHLADMATAATAMGSEPDSQARNQAAHDISLLARRALIAAGDDLTQAGQHGPAEQTYGIMGAVSDADEPAALARLTAYTNNQVAALAEKGLIDGALQTRWQSLITQRSAQISPMMKPGPTSAPPQGPKQDPKPGA